jgi:hypothetical protein
MERIRNRSLRLTFVLSLLGGRAVVLLTLTFALSLAALSALAWGRRDLSTSGSGDLFFARKFCDKRKIMARFNQFKNSFRALKFDVVKNYLESAELVVAGGIFGLFKFDLSTFGEGTETRRVDVGLMAEVVLLFVGDVAKALHGIEPLHGAGDFVGHGEKELPSENIVKNVKI